MTVRNVLISGASLAGPTLAYWLARHGFAVTVVERALKPRIGGAPIDVRGAAVDVARRMGILSRIQAARTRTGGVEFVDASGKRVARMDPNAFAEHPEQDIELERADLVTILHDAARPDVDYVFADSIESLTQDEHGVDVTFTRGAPRRFDLVVGADGLHSKVRQLVHGTEPRFVRFLGMYVAIAPLDPHEKPRVGREDWGVFHNSPGKLAGVYRHHGNADAFFLFRSPALSYDHNDADQQKKLLADAFAGERWEVPRLLAAARDAEDLYFDSVSQVRMPSWSRGRVTLVGDAGYGPALLSGMGTTLAMVGATVLADELAATPDDPHHALARYEERHRPTVRRAQAGAGLGGGILAPATRSGLWFRNQFTRLLPLLATARRLTRPRRS
jgi:2-polyprenyl-6-methoxyphenol hydroxylase-like FAD-dependent oxidoreductase